jgi:hypothetical protein
MSDLRFTTEEERAIAMFARMRTDGAHKLHVWVAEVVPAVALVSFGLLAGRQVYVIAAFMVLIAFASVRTYRQFHYSRLVRSIFEKVQAHQRSAQDAETLQQGPVGGTESK